MKTSLRCASLASIAFMTSGTLAHAHPGHDGHELTWDFGHLAAYPLATTGCLAVLAIFAWAGWRMLRRAATVRIQSLRGSQPSRGT